MSMQDKIQADHVKAIDRLLETERWVDTYLERDRRQTRKKVLTALLFVVPLLFITGTVLFYFLASYLIPIFMKCFS